jgi:4-amino-4-deoxy-L-arabinose transferase-like glycosyltransferase
MKNNKNFKKKDWLILFLILFLALILRLYKIDIPLADFHSWRQADTAAVARNFLRFGFDLLHPRFDDLSSIQSGEENPEGFRMVEFPLYNALFAFLYKNFPVFSLEIFGRLTSIFFSLLTIAIIYYLALKEVGRAAAFFSAMTFSIMPFFVYYTRVILPEPTALGFLMISVFFLYHFQQEKNKIKKIIFYFLSLIFFSSSLLIKPTVIFYSLPLLFLFFKKDSFYFLEKFYFYLYFLISILPLVFWRIYILNYPQGIPANEWLLTSVNTSSGLKNIFFRPSFFRWIFFERINNLICGGYLTFFLILGIIDKKKSSLIFSFFLASLLYLFTFQGGNVQHEYYQILIFPSISILIGKGVNFILENKNKFFSPIPTYLLIFIIYIFSFYFSFEKVKNNYQYSQELVTIANIVKKLTLEEDKIVTDRQGDTTLLYLMDRRGAPAFYKEIKDLKNLGYTYLVTQNKELIDKLKNEYQIVFESNNFALIKL